MIGPVLGVETTCDETSAGVLDERGRILALVIHSQDMHRIYGGVVPELAARDHLRRIEPVVTAALAEAGVDRRELRAVAAAAGPGLIGALLVGVSWARAAAFALGVPWVPVHHMEGHLFGPVLEDPDATPPFVALLVSGGHTMLLWVPAWGRYYLLGQTRDDAAGEAFDKVGKLLGLPYPGGPAVQAAAEKGDPARYGFPRPMMRGGRRTRAGRASRERQHGRTGCRPACGAGRNVAGRSAAFDFSFSGLKTAVARTVADLVCKGRLEDERAHVAASFQEAVVDVLTGKTFAAMHAVGCDRVLLGGGVSANGPLRARFREGLAAGGETGPSGRLFVGSPRVSLDNGAMIARAGQFRLDHGDFGELHDAQASVPLPGIEPWTAARATGTDTDRTQ